MRNIQKHFGSLHALRGASVEVHAGEVVALVGDNGAGKSTLVKVMAGVHTADSGEYLFEGKPVRVNTPTDATELGIQTVYQDLSLCSNLDAVQNLFLGREQTGLVVVRPSHPPGGERGARPRGAHPDAARQPLADPAGRRDVRRPAAEHRHRPLDPLDAQGRHSRRADRGAQPLGGGEVVSTLIRTLADQGLGIVVVSHDIHHFVVNSTDRIEVMRLGANVASFKSKDVTGEQVVNAMVGGNEGVNLAG